MEKIIIRERNGKFKGTIEIDPNGNKRARDTAGRYLGCYDAKNNWTKDRSGKVIARADILVSLIP